MKGSSKFMNKDFGFSGILGGKQSTNPGILLFFFLFLMIQRFVGELWSINAVESILIFIKKKWFSFAQISTIGTESKYDIVTDHPLPAM